ncbi:hypothetical protein [Streptomyces sp. LUP47B]|uniref:hypothetical protein n=1 Tax=Streptomyces sp. LUP47B TaxID=1890286 RepID=UPI000851FCB5|nr:hypothetical protein [Streptomyces sp. LUP47B]
MKAAEDLAQRMDYDTGHVLYREADMVARTGISRANLYRHVSYLRELGALAWVQHGSRMNRLAAMGLKGYAGTATVYAGVIPPVFDHAMGHTIVGTGYSARVIVDLRKRPTRPVDTAGNAPVDNSGSEGLETPSLAVVKEVGQVDLVGGFTTTATRTRNDSAPTQTPKRSKKRATILGNTVTAAGIHLGDKLARAIRSRVPWTRKATHDQLRWVCADMAEQQWTEDQAVRFVVDAGHTHKAGYTWEPARPHRLIAAELYAAAERQEQDQQTREALAAAIPWEESTAYRKQQAARAALAALLGAPEPEPEVKQAYTAEDREYARLYGWEQWEEVADHLAEDQDDAIDLYGEDICKFAISKQALLERRGAWV